MKKLFIALLFMVVSFSASLQANNARLVHEWTIDLYYANGVLASAENESLESWVKRTDKLKSKYPSLRQALKYGEAKLSYNASYLLGVADLFEAIGQWANDQGGQAGDITWGLLKRWLIEQVGKKYGRLVKIIDSLATITSEGTILEQVEAYKESIKDGHGVITVAHSQGNFFTNRVFERIVAKHDWMQQYLHMISVASPAKEVFGGGPHVTFDNDPINIVPGCLGWNHTNPYRSQHRNAVNEVVDDPEIRGLSLKVQEDNPSSEYFFIALKGWKRDPGFA